jgi:hypothetical protein
LLVLFAALAQWFLGALWYSPVLFGKPWQAMVAVRAETRKTAMILGMIASLVASLATSFLLLQILFFTGWGGLKRGVFVGFCVWLGFIAAPLAAQYLYEGRPCKLYAINTGYWLVALLMSGALLSR